MSLASKRYRYAALLTILSAAATWATLAKAEDADSVQKVVELNKKALAAFANLDVEEATKLLKQALEICGTAQLEKHPAAARTHVHLGAVYVAGLKQRDQGMEEFKKALRIDPTIKVTKALLNPEVQSAFAEASMDVTEGAEAGGSAPGAAQPEPQAAPPTQPAPPPQPAPPAQPPASAESAIVHTPVTQGVVGQPIIIKVQVPESLDAERVVVLYRPEGATDFLTREMDPVKDSDWYQTEIPPEATRGASVAYYILAQNAEGQPLAQKGSVEEPLVVTLGGEGVEGAGPGGETAEEGEEAGEEGRAPFLWFTLAVGSGFGYHSGTPEANRTNDYGDKLKSSGIAWSELLQIAPEVGFFISESLVVSLQGRIQIVTGATQVNGSQVGGACKGGTCQPSSYALAGLAKVTWFLGEPRRVTPFLTLAAGAGQIRHVVDLPKEDTPDHTKKQNLLGCPASNCKDTVVGGPVLFGPGAGVTVELSDSFLIIASATALVGVPNIMANLDVNLGVLYLR
jgi:tetratricopeptide (TPR) repeat protein